ncbi:MAG: tRNA lysidine(34) synthetase TilS [Cellulomonas sp. 73-92]|uniref:tRNA lysidine(34) synthetase TilS n=1 Tax=Cellulomonas sp. 73-92 TaxID=1895740 RepID=UPI0009299E06|nr:tRNA lysidine(34) synthetase TilS [Cellulomonas sp. 73-92]OJV80764.1 MAG: tRNA lysidine(34) synthetase TilS [Cellulomonas sp. 73-92]
MTGPAPAVAAVRVAVRRALAGLPAGSLVLVACSGGPDSLALAAGLAFVGPRAGLRAGAVVVDHALQAASDEVAARAATACRALGLAPVVVRRVAVAGPGGPEAAAREARYAALSAVADETGAAAVLLGHTRDDQAETVLLGLARGSGPRSLAGMAPVAGPYRRPLLGITRAQTLEACVAQGLEPWHDPTNTAGRNLRSRVRGEAMPALEEVLGPGVTAALARTADLTREQADALDELAADLLARAATSPAAGTAPVAAMATERGDAGGAGVGWDVGVLAGAPDGLRRAALHAAALAAGATPGALGRAHVLALDALVVGWHGQGPVALPGGLEAARRCGRLFLQRGTTRE